MKFDPGLLEILLSWQRKVLKLPAGSEDNADSFINYLQGTYNVPSSQMRIRLTARRLFLPAVSPIERSAQNLASFLLGVEVWRYTAGQIHKDNTPHFKETRNVVLKAREQMENRMKE